MIEDPIAYTTEQLLQEHLSSYVSGSLCSELERLVTNKFNEEKSKVDRFESEVIQKISGKKERIESGKENLLILSQKYVLNKTILSNLAKNFRRRRVKWHFMQTMKAEVRERKIMQLRSRISLKEYQHKLMRRVVAAWRESHRLQSEKTKIGELELKFTADFSKAEVLNRDLVSKMDAILKAKISELSVKSAKLDQIKQKYTDLAK